MRNATEYILMNKDVPYALFSCAQDEFGEESCKQKSIAEVKKVPQNLHS